MTTLPAFILARLAEDEAVARAATGEQWDCLVDGAPKFRRVVSWGLTPIGAMNAEGDAAHIARHDPARVLADVAAKRAIVEMHAVVADGAYCDHCYMGPLPGAAGHVSELRGRAPCPTLRHLASVYASHPEFDEGWAL